MTNIISLDLPSKGEPQVGQHVKHADSVLTTPSESKDAQTNVQGTVPESNTLHVSALAELTAGNGGEGMEMEQQNTSMGQPLGLVLGHLQSMLVSSPTVEPSLPVDVDNDARNSQQSHNTGEILSSFLEDQLTETTEIEPTPVQGAPSEYDQRPNNIDSQLSSSIDNFLESISLPIMQPLLDRGPTTPMTQSIRATDISTHINPTPSTSKRQSSRLAQKAATNLGKDAIQIAQELLVKKLGDLSGEEQQHNTDDFEFYARHFERPLDKSKMEAIQVLIEQGIKTHMKGNNRKSAKVAPSLTASSSNGKC
jgi:hypothetical protein